MGGPVGACAHNLVGWSCGGRPRALPRHFCNRQFLLLGRAALVTGAGPFRSTLSTPRPGLRRPPGRQVGALARVWCPCPSPCSPCLRRKMPGCGLAIQPLSCCPCPRARGVRLALRCGGALRNLRSFGLPGQGLPPVARGTRAGFSALTGGDFPSVPARPACASGAVAAVILPPARCGDFNSHQRWGLYVSNSGNRFISLAFLPPSIPGYRWMLSPIG